MATNIQLTVQAVTGTEAGKIDLSSNNFGVAYNQPLIHQVVVAYQAGGRSGTRAQKNRAAVRGGSAKPWRQKGTGRARAGTIRSPIFTGGGRAFPATTQDFSQKVNRKMYSAAMRSILSELTRQERLIVIDDIVLKKPKTSMLIETLHKINAPQTLIVLVDDNADGNQNIVLSARNVKAISVCTNRQINPLNLIRYEKVVMTEKAVKSIDVALS